MTLFTKATNTSAYLKCGLLGFQGSGKTYTAVELAIGLHKHIKSKKPIYFLDSETGSDWSIPACKKNNIELMAVKARSFSVLLEAVAEAEKNASILIIDSITHYWNELMESYKKANNIGARMPMHHWSILKPEWHKFSLAFTNSSLHCIICGRAGWDWEQQEDEDGFKEVIKAGTKMKAEGEFGFEPNLVIEMKREKGKNIGDPVQHIGYVVKDRRQDEFTLDGKRFIDPKFEDFLPHIECLNLGGEHMAVDTSKNSEEMFQKNGESFYRKQKNKKMLIEEINGELESKFPGTASAMKVSKAALKKHIFGTYSDTKIEDLDADSLMVHFSKLMKILHSEDVNAKITEIVNELSSKSTKTKDEK